MLEAYLEVQFTMWVSRLLFFFYFLGCGDQKLPPIKQEKLLFRSLKDPSKTISIYTPKV